MDNCQNGCGPEGPLSFLIPEFCFAEACGVHDFLFWRGGTEKDRREANKQFYAIMIKSVNARQFILQPWLGFWALWYYWNVEVFGKAFFPYSKEPKDYDYFLATMKALGFKPKEKAHEETKPVTA